MSFMYSETSKTSVKLWDVNTSFVHIFLDPFPLLHNRKYLLTLPMLRLLLSKAQGCKDFWKSSKPCHVGIHWIAFTEYFQTSTHLPGFQSFFRIFASFCIGQDKVTSSIRVKCECLVMWRPVSPGVYVFEVSLSWLIYFLQYFIFLRVKLLRFIYRLSITIVMPCLNSFVLKWW